MMTAERPDTEHEFAPVDPKSFRSVLGRFVTGVTVITTRAPGAQVAGVTVSSFNTLSLDPPLVLWSLALLAPSLRTFRASERFAVNILASDQRSVAVQFSRPAADKFLGIRTVDGLAGVPLIASASAHLECVVEQRYPGGDHELMIGRVVRASASERTPLAFGHGLFGTFSAGN